MFVHSSINSRVLATHQKLLGWETYKRYHETVELPNPRPTKHNNKKWLKAAFGPLSPTAIFILETHYKKSNPTKLSANTLVQ